MNALGIDLGGTKLSLAVFTEPGDVVFKQTIALEKRKGLQVGDLITHEIEKITRAHRNIRSIGIAVPGIYVAGEALRGFLIGVSPFDASTLLAVAVGLVGIALLACYLAARRVTSIDPDRLLREGG